MNYNIFAYLVYIPVTVGLSIWIAKNLHKNTKAFLLEAFKNQEELATSTNNLVQTGFYLIALGYSFSSMRIELGSTYVNDRIVYSYLESTQQTIEELAVKLGSFTLVLGALLFINFFTMIFISRSKSTRTIIQN